MRLPDVLKDLAAQEEAIKAFQAKGIPNLTPEEGRAFDEVCDKAERLLADVARMERANKLAGASAPTEPRRAPVEVHDNREDAPFRDIGDFCAAVINSELTRSTDPRLIQLRAASGMSEGVPSDGGYLVQKDMATAIRDRVYGVGRILARCNSTPISPNANGLKLPVVDETSRAEGSQYGGVTCYWGAEASDITASKPKFSTVDLELKKVFAATYLTDELLRDTTALNAWLLRRVPEVMRWKVENSVFRGDGAGKPLGIFNSPAIVSVAKETEQAADTIVYRNVTKMYSRLWPNSIPNARWYINSDCYPQLFELSVVVGTGGAPIWAPPSGQSPYGSLLGIPVEPVEYCSTVGDTGDIVLADFSQYELIDKGGIQNAVSIHVQFLTDEQVLRWTYRVDGQPGWKSALTPASGSANTLSPFVKLDERA